MKIEDYRKAAYIFLVAVIVFIFLWHGIPKALDPALANEKFVKMGFSGFLGPIIGWLEVVLAILILLGVWHKGSYLTLAAIILVAIIGVQLPKGVTAGLERDLLLLAGMFVLVTQDNWYHPFRKK